MPALCNTSCVFLELCSAFILCHQRKEHCWFPVHMAITAPCQALLCVLSPCCPWGSQAASAQPSIHPAPSAPGCQQSCPAVLQMSTVADVGVHTHQVTASPLTPQEIHSVTPALLTPRLLQGLGLSVPLKAITQSTDAIPATEACYFISFPLAFCCSDPSLLIPQHQTVCSRVAAAPQDGKTVSAWSWVAREGKRRRRPTSGTFTELGTENCPEGMRAWSGDSWHPDFLDLRVLQVGQSHLNWAKPSELSKAI